MTREEARLTLQENLGYLTSVHHQRILDAIKVAIEVLSEPSLPSNLDEAAEEFEKHAMEDYDEICVNEDGSESPVLNCDLKDAFKAGAKWMKGQMK